jgi:predicted nucleic acid-binding Zn ribbon protein
LSDDPVPLREGLEAFFRHLGAPPIDQFRSLGDSWPQVVGPALSSSTRPVELRDGVLVVVCDDPAWASQILWMERQIKDHYRELLPDVVIDRIRVRTAL